MFFVVYFTVGILIAVVLATVLEDILEAVEDAIDRYQTKKCIKRYQEIQEWLSKWGA